MIQDSESAKARARDFLRRFWLPLLALAVLVLVCNFNVWTDPVRARQTPPELFAHHLGHSINSIWVGISILLLVVPSLWAARRGIRDPWAWRVMDALVMDFLIVDAFGKNLFKGLSRPNHHPTLSVPFRPGFPSGHAMMAFLMAWLIWRRYPKLGPLWFTMATLIGWGRIEVQIHYPYQVIAAAFFACAVGHLICSRETGVIFPRSWLSDAALHAWLDRLPPHLRLGRSKF